MKRLIPAFLLAFQINAADVVDLVIRETAGVARLDEDVTMGVPVPESAACTDVARFALKNASGNILPCEFKSLAAWHRNPASIRWLQLNFPFSLAANDSAVVRLSYEAAPVTLTSRLTVQDRGAYFEVNTGKIRFYVKKANFNLIDQAWVDESGSENYTAANQVVAPHSRGLIYYQSDVEYLSSNDAASTVTATRQGPGMVTLTARGALKNSGGAAPLHFICHLHAFNNSPAVRISQTVENWDPVPSNYAAFQGLHAEIPLSLGATRTAVVGKPGGHETAVLSGASDLYCMVDRPAGTPYSMGSAMEGVIGGAASVAFDPKGLAPRDLGWAALSDGSKGCLAAMKYFWQMVPASVETFGDGRILLGLFSKRSGMTPNMFYAGAARTWETQFTFFNSLTNDRLRSRAAASTDRLFAVAPARYYSRDAVAAFRMMESGRQDCYLDSLWTWVAEWENKLNTVWGSVLGADNSLFGYDSYGFLEWGDNPHYTDASYPFPFNLLWNGNYYGLPFFAFEHFFHNRDLRFLNYGIAHSRHVQDVHLVHFGPSSQSTGGARYSPPCYHFHVDGNPDSMGGAGFTIDNPSHHMVECLFLDYYLTGNDYALEVALQGSDWFNRAGTMYAQPGEHTTTYVRRWAHQMYSQVWAYEHTGDLKYYNNMVQNWQAWKADIRNNITLGQPFMIGLAMEAVVKLYDILPPADSIPYFLKMWADRVSRMPKGTGSMQVNANVALGFAFLSQFYGRFYQRAAASFVSTLPVPPGNLHKDFAQQARNLEMAMYYMARPESVGLVIGVEQGSAAGREHRSLALSISPSPFNPAAGIRITGSGIGKNTPVKIRIFSTDGRLVAGWSEKAAGPNTAAAWDASGLPSGIYIVECRAAGLAARAKAVLAR